jgi:hypothetical protein
MKDIREEQSRLEAEIARLHCDIQASSQALARTTQRDAGPRGFWIGLVTGAATAAVVIVGVAAAAFFAYARFMSRMG